MKTAVVALVYCITTRVMLVVIDGYGQAMFRYFGEFTFSTK